MKSMKEVPRKDKKEKETVKLTNYQMENLLGREGFPISNNKQFPVKVRYWLARVFDTSRSKIKPYVKTKTDLLQEYSDKDRSDKMPPGQFHIPKENQEEFNKKVEEIGEEVVDLGFWKIDIKEEDLPKDLSVKEQELLLPILNIEGYD